MLTFRLQAYNAGTKYSGKLQERVHTMELVDCRAALRSRAFDNESTTRQPQNQSGYFLHMRYVLAPFVKPIYRSLFELEYETEGKTSGVGSV